MLLRSLSSLPLGIFTLVCTSTFLLMNASTTFDPESYDFIIVGGGSSGAVLAHRLSEHEKNFKVLLLEAGGHEPLSAQIPLYAASLQLTNLNWGFSTEPQLNACLGMKEQRSRCPAGRVLGGSSVINDMLYVRGNRRDYDHWASLGNSGWSWKDVFPYFLKSENNVSPNMTNDAYHGKGGLLSVNFIPYHTKLLPAFLDAVQSKGYSVRDINGEFQTGVMPSQATMQRGARCSGNTAFIRTAANRRNLIVKINSRVLRVLFDENKRASGVVYRYFDKEYVANATKEVILSAGAINTPHLLMLSGIGSKEHLEEFKIKSISNLPGVGSNFQDHIMTTGLTFTVRSDSLSPFSMVAPQNFLNWAIFGKGPFTLPSGGESIAFLKTPLANQSDDWPDLQIAFGALSPAIDYGLTSRKIIPYSDESWNKYYGPYGGKEAFSLIPILIRPRSRGLVKLRSANPYEHPIIDPKYMSHTDDLAVMLEGIKMAVSLGNAHSFKKFSSKLLETTVAGCEQFHLYSDEYWKCVAVHMSSSAFHYARTAKMGVATDPMAVVDSELRVYGVTGLRVVDCSIMPTIVSGNTNAPAVMFGEKASDMIINSWNH